MLSNIRQQLKRKIIRGLLYSKLQSNLWQSKIKLQHPNPMYAIRFEGAFHCLKFQEELTHG